MFAIKEDMSIHITRGDAAVFEFYAFFEGGKQDGEGYRFVEGDVVRFKVFAKKNCNDVVLVKDVYINENTLRVEIALEGSETEIGDYISKPVEYWYEVELNPDGNPQTIIGYDENGAKIFKLYPEGGV